MCLKSELFRWGLSPKVCLKLVRLKLGNRGIKLSDGHNTTGIKHFTEQMENEAIQQNADKSTNDAGDNDDGEPDGDNDEKSLF